MISNIELYDAPADYDEDGRMSEDEAMLVLNHMFGIKEELPRFITLEVVKSQIYATLNDPLNEGYDLKQIVPIAKPDSVRYLIVMERK